MNIETTVTVQGHPYDREKWLSVADEAENIGNTLKGHPEPTWNSGWWHFASIAQALRAGVEEIDRIHKVQGIESDSVN